MMFADPLRLACPRCDATVYQRQLWSGNSLGARYYSDRKREAPMLPTFPSFSKCPKCGDWGEVFVKMGGAIGKTGTLVADERCACGYVLPMGSYETEYEVD